MFRTGSIALLLIIMVAVATPTAGDVPQVMNYQGRLTNEVGQPLTEPVDLVIRIYSEESGPLSAAIWTEAHANVPLNNGLFDILLGTFNPIPDSIFGGAERYLGVTVNAGDESDPRVRLGSVAYAYHASVADSTHTAAAGGWVDDGAAVHLETNTDNVGIGTNAPSERLVIGEDIANFLGEFVVVGNTTGNSLAGIVAGEDVNNFGWLAWQTADDVLDIMTTVDGNPYYNSLVINKGKVGINQSSPIATLDVSGYGRFTDSVVVGLNGMPAGSIFRDDSGVAGALSLNRTNDHFGFYVDGNGLGSGEPFLTLSGLTRTIQFDLSQAGDGSVIVPTAAINSAEIQNEPGVGNSATTSPVSLENSYKTIRSRECFFPSSGYVVAFGTCQVSVSLPASGGEVLYLGFSDTPGVGPSYEYISSFFNPGAATIEKETITIHHLFLVSSGTNTFFFQGKSASENISVAISNLTVMFFPTAYGLISSVEAESGTTLEGSQASGPTLENLISERVEMQTASLKASFESELARLRQTNQSLIDRLEALEQATEK